MVIMLYDIFKPIFRAYGTPMGVASPRSIRHHLSDISDNFQGQRETKAISIPDPKVNNL